eukprot:4226038-Amphidinium_carterae.1
MWARPSRRPTHGRRPCFTLWPWLLLVLLHLFIPAPVCTMHPSSSHIYFSDSDEDAAPSHVVACPTSSASTSLPAEGPSRRHSPACGSQDPLPLPSAVLPAVRGPCTHPWNEYVTTVQGLLQDPTSELLQANVARLRRQAQRTLELHSQGRIPPLDLD